MSTTRTAIKKVKRAIMIKKDTKVNTKRRKDIKRNFTKMKDIIRIKKMARKVKKGINFMKRVALKKDTQPKDITLYIN